MCIRGKDDTVQCAVVSGETLLVAVYTVCKGLNGIEASRARSPEETGADVPGSRTRDGTPTLSRSTWGATTTPLSEEVIRPPTDIHTIILCMQVVMQAATAMRATKDVFAHAGMQPGAPHISTARGSPSRSVHSPISWELLGKCLRLGSEFIPLSIIVLVRTNTHLKHGSLLRLRE